MRREFPERSLRSILKNKPPDSFLIRDSFSDHSVALIDRAEDPASCNGGRFHPIIHKNLDERRYRDGPDAAAFAVEVGDDPTAFALLQLIEGQRNDLASSQPTGDQQRQDGTIALAFPGGRGRRLQQFIDLTCQKPVRCPDSTALETLRTLDRGGNPGSKRSSSASSRASFRTLIA